MTDTGAVVSVAPESVVTLSTLVGVVQRRLGDDDATVWTADQIAGAFRLALRELASEVRAFWDQTYLENRPPSFSYTSESDGLVASVDYGQANYTCADEREFLDETRRVGPANHTCPSEWADGWLADCGASTAPSVVQQLPDDVLLLDRVTWHWGRIQGLTPRDARALDPRYEITRGPVYAYLWRLDGPHALRQIRVPASSSAPFSVTGTFGVLRDPIDLSGDTVSGSWGLPRRIAGQHNLHGEMWGAPRRPFTDAMTTKVEYWRDGHWTGATGEVCELPEMYARYLVHFVMHHCLQHSGPGQDLKLAEWYQARWTRCLDRLKARISRIASERISQMGGHEYPIGGAPPRPQRPFNYPQDTR